MKFKKITAYFLCVTLCLQTFSMTGCSSKNELTIYKKDNEVLASIQRISMDKEDLEDEGYRAYLEIVLEEVVQAIMQKECCSKEEAEKQLFDEQYAIYTSFDETVYQSVKKTYTEYEEKRLNFGCAVTDTKGNLIVAYGAGDFTKGYCNYATTRTPPYSSLKPLSVYAPAIDAGTTSWSKTYDDAPVKQIKQENGALRDWPANASNTYSNKKVCVVEALEQSLNTVAVRCLQEYGVEEAVQYLKKNYNISLAFEENRLMSSGEDEIVGNIALGYLYDGVSPVEMAGYYQSFVTGGLYTVPKAVTKICDSKGNVIFQLQQEAKKVMNYETAFVMNELLQRVVSIGATGEEAHCDNILVGGKTGTGNEGNWFVGFTPEYTCAVWHGKEMHGNHTTEMFSKAVSGFKHNKEICFPKCNTVKISAYCMESGKLFSKGCRKIDKGYYTSIDVTEKCNEH